MFRLWSEWDIGEMNVIFATREAGMRWLQGNEGVAEMARYEKCSVEHFIAYYFDVGLFTWMHMEVVE